MLPPQESGDPDGDQVARSLAFPARQGRVLVTVTDQAGRRHRLRYRHPLVADCCELEPPRLVCELTDGEGEDQARAAARAYADQLRRGTLSARRARSAGHGRPPAAPA